MECARFGADDSQGLVTPVRENAPATPAVPVLQVDLDRRYPYHPTAG